MDLAKQDFRVSLLQQPMKFWSEVTRSQSHYSHSRWALGFATKADENTPPPEQTTITTLFKLVIKYERWFHPNKNLLLP